ncbi:ATP-binding cassette subfamily C member 4-like [Anthonomus grandis grandis]|uniref:ATP-binding cassette subfamily C member 4-like n=1 Tax=Anthonomus grandis grandis TaxID=2921223 RepID=UPI0021658254|nr:ATP-binding cassette subfamily C member 4-like [Anthonomus grandis grandis]
MDSTKKYDNPSPEESANGLSKLFYCWVLPFFKVGYNNDLHIKDIYNTTKPDLSGPLGDALERNWNAEVLNSQKTKKKPSLQRAIFKTFAKIYMFYGFIIFLNVFLIKMSQPLVLGAYIRYFEKSSTSPPARGWLLASGVIALTFISLISLHFTQFSCNRIGMRVRVACCSLMYRKLLRLNHLSLGKTAAGHLINLMSNDVARFDVAMPFLHYIWIMPIQALAGFGIMYSYIGLAAIPTMVVMTLQAIFGQGYLSKLQGLYRGKIARLTDERVKIMSEVTSGIQVIKMYAWEKPFEKVVEFARRKEVDMITRTSYIKGFSAALNVFVERGTLYIAVISFVLLDKRITGEIVFSVAQLLNTIQLYMSIFFPIAYSAYEEAKVSVRRIEEFLLMQENPTICYSDDNKKETPSSGIKLVKVRASWLPNPIAQTLSDIDLEIRPGTLCCVVGPVGSGKSSLLQVILKELPLNMGHLEAPSKISYAAQEPWLFTSNVRKNILFGLPHEKERYKQVVQVCALQRDFDELPFGDKTQVGEKGSALSGGQRARVALARAVYREADAYLLDDPLSAVDAHVANHLFEQCIQEYLKGKTRILVTHQVQFLKGADLIIVLNNGKIDKIGTFDELESDISTLSKEVEQQHQKQEKQKDEEIAKVNKRERLQSISSVISMVGSEPDETEELLEKGEIKTSTYLEYYRAGAPYILLAGLMLLMLIAQVMCNASDLWVTHWTNQEELRHKHINDNLKNSSSLNGTTVLPDLLQLDNDTEVTTIMTTLFPQLNNGSELALNDNKTSIIDNMTSKGNEGDRMESTVYYIWIYTVLILLAVILTSARSVAFYKVCMEASKRLHKKMFGNILKAPMAFFDSNPSGRILNRFSKDMGAVDEVLPKCILDTVQIFLVMSGILGMVFIVSPWMVIPAIILGYFFIWARKVYLSSAQDIKRLEGATKAPVFSHVSASLYGMTSIRSFKAQNMVIQEFDTLQDQHTSTWCLFIATSEALGFYLDIISSLFLALVTYQFLIFQDENTVSGNVGLVIAQSMILTGMLQYGVRQSAEVSSNIISVERVLQYTRLEQEGPWDPLPAHRPPTDWPRTGQVAFKHAYLRYTPDAPPSIKDLNAQLRSGEKVGIVGRTGAGKSSLVATLFRLAPVEGRVEIDELDTANVGLKALRSSISIIPQVPTLFSASLRYNLDPFEKCSDEELWKALERVELKQSGVSLNATVSEGGANFSAGQRQLICLARAIVRNNKILVMDEATANVDQHTDSLIQSTIRDAFKDRTVITIAHRLNTIIDSDRVMVMDHGEAVEFDSPHLLLQNADGYFTKMVEQTGPNMEAKLRQLAKEAYESHQNSNSNNELVQKEIKYD